MTRKSIFEIERRKDIVAAYKSFLTDLKKTHVYTWTGFGSGTMRNYLDYCIRYWPYRHGASSISDYLENIFVFEDSEQEEDILYALELFVNLLRWGVPMEIDKRGKYDEKDDDVWRETNRLVDNLKSLLEQCCNMRIRELNVAKDDIPKYVLSKRDAEVDAAIESAPELSEFLLGYLDLRNQNDSQYKRNTLIQIANYLESKRKNFKNTEAASIADRYFEGMNKFGIRHNNDGEIPFKEDEQNEWYDKLFKMGLYLIMSEDVNEYAKEIKSLIHD